MDLSESTGVVFNRIQKIEPELASKIIGYLLLQDYGKQDMLRLAFGPDSAIASLINEAKSALPGIGLSPKPAASPLSQSLHELPHQFPSYPPVVTCCISSPMAMNAPPSYWDSRGVSDQHLDMRNVDYFDSIGEDYQLQNHLQLEENFDHLGIPIGNFPNNYYYQEIPLGSSLGMRTSRRSINIPEIQMKACHYYYKGYCKHGTNCRYFHGQATPDSFPQAFSPHSNEVAVAGDAHPLTSCSLDKLEVELTELLRSRGGQPISIAMLPMLYYEKYGKVLQAEGYLTESQRHGKAGYSLTKLLARLKKSIRLIDRPHGQHAVMLAEDAPSCLDYKIERNDSGSIIAGSQQIYLTFPAESTFAEDDVSSYFSQYGPVHAVRIPAQQKRMFGFVTFAYPETVKIILLKGNPHYICGARVLVKPYREKTKTIERKYGEKVESTIYYTSQYLEIDDEFHSTPQVLENSGFHRKLLLDEQERAFEVQMRQLNRLQLAPTQLDQRSYFGNTMEGPRLLTGSNNIQLTDHFGCQFDTLNSDKTGDERARNASNSCNHQETITDYSHIDLPESPFASPHIGSSVPLQA